MRRLLLHWVAITAGNVGFRVCGVQPAAKEKCGSRIIVNNERKNDRMEARFYIDPETGLPHLYSHGMTEAEVLQVLRKPGPVYRGDRNSRLKSGQNRGGALYPGRIFSGPGRRQRFRDHRVPVNRQSTQGISATTTEKATMTKMSGNSRRRKASKGIKQKFPPAWNERKVRAVIKHYEQLTDEEMAREIESAPEVTGETLISVPTELVPAIQKLIVRHQQST
jgi:hypothetical protein